MKFVAGDQLPLVEQDTIEDCCIDDSCCPDRLQSAEFPSPTGCLPEEELAELKERINAANNLLLDLALDDDRPPEETFLKVFSGLMGLQVKVEVEGGRTVEGKVHTAGHNFVVLLDEHTEVVLPYRTITKVEPCGRFAEPDHEAELREIDPCLRRDLTFNFGATVASSPELLHLFFRMRFNIYLLFLEAKTIELTQGDETIEGFVTDVNEESVVLKVKKEIQIIPMEKITMIKIKK
jgi:ribosome maturation factor RimP